MQPFLILMEATESLFFYHNLLKSLFHFHFLIGATESLFFCLILKTLKAFEPYGDPEEMRRDPGDMHGILFQVSRMVMVVMVAMMVMMDHHHH